MAEAGVVRGVHADIDPAKVGYGVRAVVGINVPQPGKKALIDKLRQSPQVLECHHVSGNDSYVMQVVARDLPDLERFLGDINGYGETRTSIVFSTPIPLRGLARALCSGRRPHVRRRQRADTETAMRGGENEDFAPAI